MEPSCLTAGLETKFWCLPVPRQGEEAVDAEMITDPEPLDVNLTGKVAFVAGGAGAIGSAIARALSLRGAKTVIADVSPQLEEVCRKITTETGSDGQALRVDLTQEAEIESAFEKTVSEFGQLDIMVHAAGIYHRKPLLELSSNEWDLTQNINMRSFFLCTKYAVSKMMTTGVGRIIGITSGMGVAGKPRSAAYCASKAAMIVFAQSVALELARTSITINLIGPGITDTPLMRNANTEDEIQASLSRDGRPLGSPENVVGPVLYLLSEATKSVTGTTVWMRSPI